jgi:hypothetical protein
MNESLLMPAFFMVAVWIAVSVFVAGVVGLFSRSWKVAVLVGLCLAVGVPGVVGILLLPVRDVASPDRQPYQASRPRDDASPWAETNSMTRPHESPRERQPPIELATVPSGRPWDAATEATFDANVYCSAEAAALGLARLCQQQLTAELAETPAAIEIELGTNLADHTETIGIQLAKFFRDAFPLAKVSHHIGQQPDRARETVTIRISVREFSIDNSTRGHVGSFTYARGTIGLDAGFNGTRFVDARRFSRKPWVEQLDEFVNRHPERSMLRGDSQVFTLTESAAYRDAQHAATAALIERAYQLTGSRDTRVPEGELRRDLLAAMARNELIVDRFAQELQGDFGRVWRATVLIDYDPDSLAAMLNRSRATVGAKQRQRTAGMLATGLMFLVIVVVYFTLNELTKGYFVWSLRATTFAMLLMIAIAACWWVGSAG